MTLRLFKKLAYLLSHTNKYILKKKKISFSNEKKPQSKESTKEKNQILSLSPGPTGCIKNNYGESLYYVWFLIMY